jgi:hypothetical protein
MKRVKSRGGFLRMCFTQDIAPTNNLEIQKRLTVYIIQL